MKTTASGLFMVFDVESVGLHGEGFAFGYVVVDGRGVELEAGCYACAPGDAHGMSANRKWVAENIPKLQATHNSPLAVRSMFWSIWRKWQAQGAVLMADCAWPVEARFLIDSVSDDLSGREWEGPYPLHDLASVLLAMGRDPLAISERLPNELPAHHPLNDARQSARLLAEALNSTR